jgi:hypothetical protein
MMLRAGRAAAALLRVTAQHQRGFASGNEKITATLFTGDGIGPEICEAVKKAGVHRQHHCPCTATLRW